MSKEVFLIGIDTAVPHHKIAQSRILRFMTENLELDDRHAQFLTKIYAGSAIDQRYSVIPDFGLEPEEFQFFPPSRGLTPEPTTATRNSLFVREADQLAENAAGNLLGRLDVDPLSITHLITASCTGFSAPGFDFHLVGALPLAPTIERTHLGFMGCYSALPALKLARHICRSDPDAVVLVVNVEICTPHFRNGADLDTLVVNSLFADGASAALVSARGDIVGSSARLVGFASTIAPKSENEMAWIIGDHGFDMQLSSYVPAMLGEQLPPLFEGLLEGYGLSTSSIDRYAIHPGGRAIVDRVGDALGLKTEELSPSYQTLAGYGNMSSATIMFVLERILASDSGSVVAAAFGPGLTFESAFLELG